MGTILALILLFGRSGFFTGIMADWFGIPRSRWIYGLPGVLLAQAMGWPLSEGWIVLSLLLYVVTGLFWLPVV
jgi:uncharacterized membrane protein